MDRRTLAAVSLITGAGLAFRLLVYPQALFGDELSTLYLVEGANLGQVISAVSSDAEITPPLYFLLALVATRLGDAPELVRLPALIAGTALIPLTYALGARAAGRTAGLFAAGLTALAPFMIFFAATGRAYTVMLLFLVGATLCLLRSGDGKVWWQVGWVACAAAAMYSHYTAVFVLGVQVAWAFWAFPTARRRLMLMVAGAALLFLPWLGQLRNDLDSPTNDLLQHLQGSGLDVKGKAVAQWAFGHPVVEARQLPTHPVWVAMLAAVFVAAAATVARHRDRLASLHQTISANPVMFLVALAAVVTPLAEGLLALFGNDLFGARNLTASWPFGAILVAFLVTRSGRPVALCTGLVIVAGFAYGAVRTVTTHRTPDYGSAAREIESQAKPGDTVIDLLAAPITPVPLTPLRAEIDLPPGVRLLDVNQPLGEPPFLPLTPKADPGRLLEAAFRRSRGGRVFVVGPAAEVIPGSRARYLDGDVALPAGWTVEDSESFPGLVELNLFRAGRP